MYESAPSPDKLPSSRRWTRQVAAVLEHQPAGLFTDLDGTVSRIRLVPSHARVVASARRGLADLRSLLAVVGVVTGREATDAQRMVGLDGLLYVGNHGAEWLHDGQRELLPEAATWAPRIRETLEYLQSQLAVPGLIFEDKGATASIHYRLAADHESARAAILAALSVVQERSGLLVEEGRMVINLLPPIWISKGTAMLAIAERYRLRSLVYLGDDVTDTHAFAALRQLRAVGLRTLSIAVVGAQNEMVLQSADACLPNVAAAGRLLERLPGALAGSLSRHT